MQIGHEFVDEILHGAIERDIMRRMTLMDEIVAFRTRVVLLLEVSQEATLADCIPPHSLKRDKRRGSQVCRQSITVVASTK
jgi:hypothetical protein